MKIFSLLLNLLIVSTQSSDYIKDIKRCTLTEKGKEYIGTISITESGKTCRMWDKSLTLLPDLKEISFPEKNATSAQNYCRNPNSRDTGTWCFYGDKADQWETCNIPACYEESNCKDTAEGTEYEGSTNVTISGLTCQQWAMQTPHGHRFKGSSFPDQDLNIVGNKCRNPDREESPWCYTMDPSKRWEFCNVLFCDKRLSQAEYFRGRDILKSLDKYLISYIADKLVTNIKVEIIIPINFWTADVQNKISVWSTKYSSNCQRDLNYYEYCRLDEIINDNLNIKLKYTCTNPSLSAIIISSLQQSQFTEIKWNEGRIYSINNAPGADLVRYMQEIDSKSDPQITKITTDGNGSPFYLLMDNVVPYALTTNGEVFMTISKVGLGQVAFMGGEFFVKPEYQIKLQNLYSRIYGTNELKAEFVTKTSLQNLETQWKNNRNFKVPAIWNAHETIGKENVKLLLTIINNGLNVIVGVKSWAYHHYVEKIEESELTELFLAAGLWPSTAYVNADLQIVTKAEFKLLPLIHLLEYAKTNRTAAAAVSALIKTRLSNVPFARFSETQSGASLLGLLKSKLSELYNTHIDIVTSLVPCVSKPIDDKNNRLLFDLYASIVLNPFNSNLPAPGINFYPGEVDTKVTPLESVQIKLYLPFKDENYPVGVFVKASENFEATISAKKSTKCTLIVNFHLFDISNWDRYDKWPITRKDYVVESKKTNTFSNPFGGLLSISCDTNEDNVDLVLKNVIRVPMYDLRNGKIDKSWNQLRNRQVPFAILASDTMVFIVPSIAIRNMADPQPIMRQWDQMTKEQFHLRGRSVVGTSREMISTDFQIKAGYMHAGYPIGTFIQHVANPGLREKFLFAPEKFIKEGYWGINHEVGHNLQASIFTFFGTVDVTNNVFTLVAVESISGLNSWNNTNGWVTGYLSNIIKYFKEGNFSVWQKDPFIGLGTYAQLRSEFGWEFYRQIFRRYDRLVSEMGKGVNSLTDEQKIQLWIKESSELVKMNLVPLYDYWRWPIEDTTKKSLEKYPLFLAEDFLTKLTPDRSEEILLKYGGKDNVSRKPLTLPQVVGPLKNKGIEGPIIIEEITLLQS